MRNGAYAGMQPEKRKGKQDVFSDKYIPLLGNREHILTMQDAVVVIVAAIICGLYICCLNLYENVGDRWKGYSSYFQLGASLHCALSLYELMIYALLGKQWEFYLHHIAVLFVYWPGATRVEVCFFLAWAGLVEITNVPLSSLTILGRLKMKESPLYLFCGVSLYVTYVISRMISLPLTLLWLLVDLFTQPGETWNVTSRPFITYCIVSCLGIFALSAMWFSKIHNGLMKHLNAKPKKTEKQS
eukprot:CAMPEP_0167755718 /NCGR_PEP_ID=MMETSP0110_2-20121227/8982_1 /TAXON_ID=629695 /ORGANISM="Gymnochlora sp., Strain CCMP2014" /LENGTH=242 /DNA_ID=CAMNT_0007641741 /DNA_START=112 /DNA_END=840 /DNA_ORIENTATION=-